MEIEIERLSRHYGQYQAVQDVSFSLNKGEMLALLGPSGCGKTTTLRMVAGFVKPSGGTIRFQGRDVTALAPHKRDTGLVFQNYALFPHLSVQDNVAFGLKRRGVPTSERKTRIEAILNKVKLAGLEKRFPRQLSGGQQQRVAVARALVIEPAILLLDEPFSNLDAKLRESTGLELRRLQRELGLTSLFVTHDQVEAMTIADRVAVMNAGKIEQLGSAADIYERPATRFVADFIGNANFVNAQIVSEQGGVRTARLSNGATIAVPLDNATTSAQTVSLMIRPQHLTFEPGDSGREGLGSGEVEAVSYQGAVEHLYVRLDDGPLWVVADTPRDGHPVRVGTRGQIRVDGKNVRIYSATA